MSYKLYWKIKGKLNALKALLKIFVAPIKINLMNFWDENICSIAKHLLMNCKFTFLCEVLMHFLKSF